MAAKLPWFRWYPTDFDSDEHVKLMDLEEIGLYAICLNHAWVNGSLPAEPSEIARAMKVQPKIFARTWPRVSRCFLETEPGRLTNKRQEKERAESRMKSDAARASIEKRWRPDPDTNVSKTYKGRNTRASDSDSVSGSVVVVETTNTENLPTRARDPIPPIDFEFREFIGFFLALGVAISETDMRRCAMFWVSMSLADKLAALTDVRAKAKGDWAGCEVRYVPRPWNYLGGKQWERIAVVVGREKAESKGEAAQRIASERFSKLHPEIL